ncbi:MAG: LysR family transcriptional regulator [Candidatus Dadabacteria bacterium]|nr:MAG: LysR family transcriptional regulator [Candidatus Dadabacteria bacterium]
MDLIQLKLFVDVARSKSFSRAARANYITQPSVSLRIKQLEDELGVRLFDRTARQVQLTPEGHALISEAEKIMEQCNHFAEYVSMLKGSPSGDIRIATIPSVGMYHLGEYLKRFLNLYPNIHFNLQYRNSGVIYDLLAAKKIDAGLVAYPEKRTGLDVNVFAEEPLVLAVNRQHPLSAKKTVSLNDLEGQDFISFEENIPTGAAIDKILKQHSIKVNYVMTNNNIDAIKHAVEAGLGMAIVPALTVEQERKLKTLAVIKIKENIPPRPIALLAAETTASIPLNLFKEVLIGTQENKN